MKFDTADEAHTRLTNTIIMYAGEPIYVKQCFPQDHEIMIEGAIFGSGAPASDCIRHIKSTDKDLTAKIPLGYVNAGARAVYCSRMPARQTKQGISGDNVYIKNPDEFMHVDRNITWSDIKLSTTLRNTIMGKFLGFEEALDIVSKQQAKAMAFHRHFALQMDHFRGDSVLMYKGDKIGFGDQRVGIKLTEQFKHLKEAIAEKGVKLCG